MKVKEQDKETLPEYKAEIIDLIWSIPSVHNVTGTISRGFVLLMAADLSSGDTEQVLQGFRVSKSYDLSPLPKSQLDKVRFIWDQISKSTDSRILAIGGNRKLSHRQLRKAMFESNLLGGKDIVKSKGGSDEPHKKTKKRSVFYDLDHTMEIGKHKGKKVRDIIDNNPGWIAWALSNIGENFLNAPARKYYNDSRRAKRK